MKTKRSGFSIIELLVAVSIIAITIALLTSAIVKVRFAALHLQSKHKLGQLALAYHHSDEQYQKKQKAVDFSDGGGYVFESLLPFLELADSTGKTLSSPAKFYLSSLDPSIEYEIVTYTPPPEKGETTPQPITKYSPKGTASYCVNSVICTECAQLKEIRDGTSNTILFSERYSICEQFSVHWSLRRVPASKSQEILARP